MKGEGLKGCGRARATDGGGLRMGVAVLLCFGCPGDGNCGVVDTTVPFFIGAVLTLDGTAAAAMGAVVDVGVGVGVGVGVRLGEGVVTFPGEGCCGDGVDVLVPFTNGVVLAGLGVAAAAAEGGSCCPCCCCCCCSKRKKSKRDVSTVKLL